MDLFILLFSIKRFNRFYNVVMLYEYIVSYIIIPNNNN